MNAAPKLASYPLFYEQIPAQIPKSRRYAKRRPGRKPRWARLPEKNVLENLKP